VSRKWRNWYQNEVEEEIKGADFRDKVKHNERRMGLLLAPDSVSVQCSNCVFNESFAVALAVVRGEFRYVS